MAAPSKAWVSIADSQVAADAPGDTILMTGIRDDLVHLREWLGLSYTAAQDHDHDGVNSKGVIVPDGTIYQNKLGYSAGDVLFLSSDVDSAILITSTLTLMKEAKISRNGTIRINFTMVHGWTSGSLPITGQIYRSRGGTPTAVGTLRTMVGTDPDTEYSEDISGWEPGDLVQIKCTAYNNEHSAMIKNFRLYDAYYLNAESITLA